MGRWVHVGSASSTARGVHPLPRVSILPLQQTLAVKGRDYLIISSIISIIFQYHDHIIIIINIIINPFNIIIVFLIVIIETFLSLTQRID